MSDLRLVLRAFLWRRGGSLVVLVVGALTVAAAAIGPLYSAAAAQSVLQDRLVQATGDQTTIAFRTQSDVSYGGTVDVVARTQAERGSIPGYGPFVAESLVPSSVAGPTGGTAKTQVLWRDGACEHLVVVAGRCPTAATEVMVSDRAAQEMGWKLGTRLTFSQLRQYDGTTAPSAEARTRNAALEVVGTYRPRSTLDPFWAGRVYFTFDPGAGDLPGTIDAVFVDRSVFPTLVTPTLGSIGADLLLTDPQAIRVDDVPALRSTVESYLGPESDGPAPQTGILDLLDRFDSERTQTLLAASVVSSQLALLALLLLYLVILDTSEARGGEVALAKLRGLRPAGVLAVALREPVVLLVLAVPLGLALAYAGARALAGMLFVAGVPVEVTTATWVAVGVAFLGGLAAAIVASRRMFTRPVLDQWSSTPESARGGRTVVVLDVVLLLAALLGFAALDQASRHSGEEGSLGLALGWVAPGLLVIAAALLLVRLAVPLLSGLVRGTRGDRRVGLFLAARQVVRRPSGLRLAGLLAVTIGLATFAVDAQAAAAQSRLVRAGAEVGATSVVHVQPTADSSVAAAVAKADPEGRWAMAVADWVPGGGSVAGRVLAVDSPRLASVALWSPDYGAGPAWDVARSLRPDTPDPVPVTGTRVRVTLEAAGLGGPAATVVIGLRDAAGRPTSVRSTALREGTHDYVAALPSGLRATFYGVAFDRSQVSGTSHLDVRLTGAAQSSGAAWTDLRLPLTDPTAWRLGAFTGTANGSLTVGPQGPHYTGEPSSFASPYLQYADVPSPLPMVTTPRSTGRPTESGEAVVDGLGRTVPVRGVVQAKVLPVVGDDGVMVDLATLLTSAQVAQDARWQVWLSADAPADAVARLEAAGLSVDTVTTTAARADELGREGPALALRLMLVCAIVGAVLSASAVAISVAVTGRRRSYELAALRAIGVRRASLVRACVLEQALLLGIGLVVGVPTGLVVARLALPSLPQSASPTAVPLTVDIQSFAVTTFVVITAVLLLATAVVAGMALVRRAVPDLLREAAP